MTLPRQPPTNAQLPTCVEDHQKQLGVAFTFLSVTANVVTSTWEDGMFFFPILYSPSRDFNQWGEPTHVRISCNTHEQDI